ncbi:MAG: L,D-transpeptidase [Oscillatoria princeps RMCB-10]|nr:L,D-transpeptidase [Oscillatoria princeps RMCB-10]
MKSAINYSWWRRSGTFWAGASLIVSTLCVWATPLLAEPANADAQHNKIANRILALQESAQRWIEIDLSKQRLVAWEGDKIAYAVVISTGKDGTPTPTGTFAIQTKHRVARMQGEDYDVPDVPFTMYYEGSYAIHGAYWHNKFGTPVSHGCTNVAVNHAEWLYNWASVGTPVVVHD